MPVVFSGVRTSTVQTIGNATLGAFVGGITLGRFIFQGLAEQSPDLTMLGSIALVVIARPGRRRAAHRPAAGRSGRTRRPAKGTSRDHASSTSPSATRAARTRPSTICRSRSPRVRRSSSSARRAAASRRRCAWSTASSSPTPGTVSEDGRDVRDFPPEELRRHIGYAIQGVGLFPHFTVAENIGVVPRLLGWEPSAHRRARHRAARPRRSRRRRVRRASTPTSSPAARRSASGWRGRLPPTRRCC